MKQGLFGSVPIPPDDALKEKVIDSLVDNVESMIKSDRKITSLKQLQVRHTHFYLICSPSYFLFLKFIFFFCYSGSYLENWIRAQGTAGGCL